jgi:O-antigen/teichoic acid export membrane protein
VSLRGTEVTRPTQHLRLSANTAASIAEVLISGLALFLLFRVLISELGVEEVGVWSLVLAATSFARIADLGVAGAMLRFVSMAQARQRMDEAVGYVETAVLSVAVAFLALVLIAYPPLYVLMAHIVPAAHEPAARALLPYALASFYVGNIAGVLLLALGGAQRLYLRSTLGAAGNIVLLAGAIALVPRFGVNGAGMAQLLQMVFLLASGWFCLRRCMPALSWFPVRWHSSAMRAMLAYGLRLQVVAIAFTLYDPMVKILMTTFGGLGMVAYYEMASRMVLQTRAVIVAANYALVPAFSDLNERGAADLSKLYSRATRATWSVAPPIMAALVACTPLISFIWLGGQQSDFIRFGIIVALGWLVNILTVPTFMLGLGTGHLIWNVRSQIAVAVSVAGGSLLALRNRSVTPGASARPFSAGETVVKLGSIAAVATVNLAAVANPRMLTPGTWGILTAVLLLLLILALLGSPRDRAMMLRIYERLGAMLRKTVGRRTPRSRLPISSVSPSIRIRIFSTRPCPLRARWRNGRPSRCSSKSLREHGEARFSI